MESGSDPLGLVGTTIAEKYAIESIVGQGGFAIVYRAMHALWKRPVAVKVFTALGEVAAHERQQLLDDFIQEGRLLADLSERSTAICQARDIGMTTTPRGAQVPYMVLEWLDGEPLEAVLAAEKAANRPLRSLEETVRLLDPVAEALALAHKKGIAHRDVKPANVFVLGDPRGADVGVKLLDFGIAKVVQDAQKMGFGKTAGHITSFTPSYGAPEQFNRAYGATGPWTDVFALALVTVEVLSGQEPLSGDTLVQLAFAASDTTTRPVPRTFGVQTSDEVDAVFRKALAVKPDDRYATVGELWNALRVATIGHPLSSIVAARSDPSLRRAVLGDATIQTAELGKTEVAPAAAAPSARSTTSPRVPAQRSRSGLAIGGGVAVVVAAAVAVVAGAGGRKPTATPVASAAAEASAIARASTSASAAAVAAPRALDCPPGMKAIRGGQYFMGSDEKEADAAEKPPHKVTLEPYCLDELEVSVERYKKCSNPGACLHAGRENFWDGITEAQQKLYDPLCNINDAVKKANHPVNCVDWHQAARFCEWSGGRLPTEAEWEFAARGSDGRRYPWGDTPPSAELLNACGKECVAWMRKHPDPDQPIVAMYDQDDGWPQTAPVGSFPKGASSWGIQDMVGNVWEWVSDWYAPYTPESAGAMTPNPKGPAAGTERSLRGGSWNAGPPAWVRPSWRYKAVPAMRTHGIGFRCAKSL